MATCRSCGADVVFVPSAKSGKPMILDAKPSKGVALVDATVPLETWDKVMLVGFGPLPADDRVVAAVISVYTDHHATCPAAKDWQGRTRKDAGPNLRDLPAEPLQLQGGPTRGHAGR